jgi:hypothetical protein
MILSRLDLGLQARPKACPKIEAQKGSIPGACTKKYYGFIIYGKDTGFGVS